MGKSQSKENNLSNLQAHDIYSYICYKGVRKNRPTIRKLGINDIVGYECPTCNEITYIHNDSKLIKKTRDSDYYWCCTCKASFPIN